MVVDVGLVVVVVMERVVLRPMPASWSGGRGERTDGRGEGREVSRRGQWPVDCILIRWDIRINHHKKKCQEKQNKGVRVSMSTRCWIDAKRYFFPWCGIYHRTVYTKNTCHEPLSH